MNTRMPKRVKIVAAVLSIVALVAGAWYAWDRYSAGGDDGGRITATGSVESDSSQVSSVMAGRIESVLATEGAAVKTGDVLFTLDDNLLYAQVQQAKAGVRAAKAQLKQVTDDDGTTAQKAVAQARIEQAEQALAMAQTQLGYATVRSASDGVITAVAVRVGENASPGKSLATVSDLGRLHVVVFIPETEIGRVALGGPATITTDSSPDEFSGSVSFIAEEAEFTPSYIETRDQRVKLVYEVRLSVEDAGTVLKPGMPVDVTFE